MIEQVLNARNIMRAYRQVVSNNGSAGVDGMSVKELHAYLDQNRTQIESDIRAGKYLPQPILRVEILKSNGKKRLLGIPTVMDRLLQQAVGQILANRFEMEFDDYKVRWGVRQNSRFVKKGYTFVNQRKVQQV